MTPPSPTSKPTTSLADTLPRSLCRAGRQSPLGLTLTAPAWWQRCPPRPGGSARRSPRGQRAVPGLVGDGAVGRTAQVGIGDDPARSHCADHCPSPTPARAIAFWTSTFTDSGCSPRPVGRLPLVTLRSTGALMMSAVASQVRSAVTGQRSGRLARGRTTSSPTCRSGWSWSGAARGPGPACGR
jgi:hypothetical protein